MNLELFRTIGSPNEQLATHQYDNNSRSTSTYRIWDGGSLREPCASYCTVGTVSQPGLPSERANGVWDRV
ncbi:hypothetical protein TNCV_932711 [Trichonephila clavipes]|nr:hypothetical protein TNCV_932711 [Trichonephila clavipes]